MQDKDTFNKFIDELIDKNDILEVVRGYVELTRKGNSYWGCCPFHHEKTASFHVEERLKIYKCFGCGAAGNVIKFVQEIESVSFMEAVKILADRVGMKVPEFSKRSEENLKAKKDKQERHFELVAVSARYYHNELIHSPKILEYLHSHGIDNKTITAYGLGYSPNHFGIINHLMSLGYSESEIDEAGVGYTTKADKFQDVMAGRIVCPHINTFGKVAGFAGSLRNGNTIYTKNTDIFRQDSEVFGTHLLKAIKMKEGIDNLILTSTPLSAVALRAKGRQKVVSIMGNAVTPKQARALMRFTDKFTVLFSDTENGISKDYQGIDALLEEGASVKVASLTEHISVVDSIENKTFDAIVNRLKRAKSLLEYQLLNVSTAFDLSTDEGKNAYIEEAKGYIMAIKERSKQEPYISVLSKIAKVREDSIRKSFYQDADKSNAGTKRVTNKKTKEYTAMMSLLALTHAGYPVEDISEYLYGEYKDFYLKDRENKVDKLSAYFTDKEVEIMESVDVSDKSNAKLVKDCIKVLHTASIKRQQDEIVSKIASETDVEKKKQLMAELNKLYTK